MRLSTWPLGGLIGAAALTAAMAACSGPGDAPASAPATTAPQTSTEATLPTASQPPAAQPPAPADEPIAATPEAAPAAARAAAPAAASRAAATARRAPATEPAAEVPAAAPVSAAPAPAAPPPPPAPSVTELTVPSGTTLSIELKTALASDTSRVEERVRGVLRRPLLVNGQEVAPAGTAVTGHVTDAAPAGKVKGRARLALRFSSIAIGDGDTPMATAAIAREAASTKKEDAAKIGIGAGAGAVIGAIAGGKKGAVVGGTIGAGAGTGVVLATRGDEVELPAGTALTTTLSQPLVVRVRLP